MTAEIWRIRRAARTGYYKGGLTWIHIGVNTVFSEFGQNKPTFFEFKFKFAAPGSKYGFAVFYREFKKLATGGIIFVLVASAVATLGPGGAVPLYDCLCPPHFCSFRMLFWEHHVTTRQQAIMEKKFFSNMILVLKFSRLFAKLLATQLLYIKCDPIIRIINTAFADASRNRDVLPYRSVSWYFVSDYWPETIRKKYFFKKTSCFFFKSTPQDLF